ncbi:dephospho-CoA kinase [Flaviflexus massiliensis]|uniref:dephospho-CoA kinase n=1 Tax=Flaviflexus massiliensis TaxID=1522309 RepID=UPI0006D536B3|nr:dephospho-CoA kinase [Flaviflexus massiliensis]
MLFVGLTGGIGSGKSEVSKRLAQAGFKILDADEVSRSLTAESGEAVPQIAELFPDVVENGIIDRAKLADVVFSDPEKLEQLNGVIHPRVRDRMAEQLRAYVDEDPRAIVVEDSPLLIETGRAYVHQFLVLITTPDDTKIERLVRDRGMTAEQARARINTQLTDEERVPFADVVIDNHKEMEWLDHQVVHLIDRIRKFEDNVVTGTVPEPRNRSLMNAERLKGKLAHTGTTAVQDGMDLIVPPETSEMVLRHVCCVPYGDMWVRPDQDAWVRVRLEKIH